MLEIIIIILIIILIASFGGYIWIIILPLIDNKNKELKKLNKKIDLITNHIHFNHLYDNGYYVEKLFELNKNLKDKEEKIAFDSKYDEETYYIKNMDQNSLLLDFYSINMLYFKIHYHNEILKYIKDLEVKTLSWFIKYEDGKKKYNKYMDKAPTYFNFELYSNDYSKFEKDFNDYSKNIENTLNSYEDLIKYKWFDREEIKKGLLNEVKVLNDLTKNVLFKK